MGRLLVVTAGIINKTDLIIHEMLLFFNTKAHILDHKTFCNINLNFGPWNPKYIILSGNLKFFADAGAV